MHEIMESEEIDNLISDCEKQPSGVYNYVSADEPPSFN